MKRIFSYFLLMMTVLRVQAQDTSRLRKLDSSRVRGQDTLRVDSNARHRVAVFLPLYLDSAYDAAGNYRYDKNFPKFINPGLEFYEGIELALDTMRQEGVKLNVHIYDTRSMSKTIQQVVADSDFAGTELILGSVINGGEEQQLAAAGLAQHIPFINVNFPNDAGITGNPDLVILNSTLRAHCEGIYRYLQRNYPTKPLVFFRKKGTQEDRLKNYFTDLDHTTAGVPLKIEYVMLEDNFDAPAIAAYLDSGKQTICIAGSLDDGFGLRLTGALASMKSYPTVLIGMPTWDNLDFSRPEVAAKEVIYTTPFYFNPADTLVKTMNQLWKGKFYSRPSDMVFRGYECMYRFGHLLCIHGKDLAGAVGEKKFKVFNDFNIEPVFLNRQSMTLDYMENKKLYFIHKVGAEVTAVN
jgi:hypothetical protein